MASAVRAAAVIGEVGLAAVLSQKNRLGDRREPDVGGVAVVAPRLRVEAEGDAGGEAERGVGGVAPRMAAVGGEDGKAARQRRNPARGVRPGNIADGGLHVAIRAAVALMQEPSVPDRRQPHLEADRVMFPIAPSAIVDPGPEHAMFGQPLPRRLKGRGFNDKAGDGELFDGRGRAGFARPRVGGGKRQHDGRGHGGGRAKQARHA